MMIALLCIVCAGLVFLVGLVLGVALEMAMMNEKVVKGMPIEIDGKVYRASEGWSDRA